MAGAKEFACLRIRKTRCRRCRDALMYDDGVIWRHVHRSPNAQGRLGGSPAACGGEYRTCHCVLFITTPCKPLKPHMPLHRKLKGLPPTCVLTERRWADGLHSRFTASTFYLGDALAAAPFQRSTSLPPHPLTPCPSSSTPQPRQTAGPLPLSPKWVDPPVVGGQLI